jgi:hypothetical protein
MYFGHGFLIGESVKLPLAMVLVGWLIIIYKIEVITVISI